MTRTQRKALRTRVVSNLKFQRKEFKKLNSLGSRYHLKQDRVFKVAFSTIKKDIRLYRRLNSRIK